MDQDATDAGRAESNSLLNERIEKHRTTLMDLVNTKFGLIDELCSMEVLNLEQTELIQSKSTYTAAASQLLDELVKLPNDKQQQFLSALDNTSQSHVSHFIRKDGKRPAITTDGDYNNWPVRLSAEWKLLIKALRQLNDLLDLRNGFLEEIFSAGVISSRQKSFIEDQTTYELKKYQFFYILERASVESYEKFMQCLINTEQLQLVSILRPKGVSDDVPLLEKSLVDRLQACHAMLVKLISSKYSDLIDAMFSKCCITSRQKEFIESASTESECNNRLLDIVRQGTRESFDKFMACLRLTGQDYVCQILLDHGAVAHIVAKTSDGKSIKENERRVVSEFVNLMRAIPTNSRPSVFDEVRRLIDDPLSADVNLLALDTESSIGMYFLCASHDDLVHLHYLFSSGRLVTVCEHFFNRLLGKEAVLNVRDLHWKMSNYIHCVKLLSLSEKPPLLKRIYELAEAVTPDDCGELGARATGLHLGSLPHELTEIILIKSSKILFKTLSTATVLADVYTMATFCYVSFDWWQALTYRRIVRQIIKRCFAYACLPFAINPQVVSTHLHTGEADVYGIAVVNEKIHVVGYKSDTVRVFSSSPPCALLECITIAGLSNPTDMAGCSANSCLYIADSDVRCVWKVSTRDDHKTDKFLSADYEPYSLSVNRLNRHVTVVPYDGSSLYVYSDVDGGLVKCVSVPKYMMARYAVETRRETFIVCHISAHTQQKTEDITGFSELSSDGSAVLRVYEGSRQLGVTRFLVVEVDGQLLVTDRYSRLVRVFGADLRLRRVLLDELQGPPYRWCYCHQSKLLCVGYYSSNCIGVYRL